jgi:hypothetical protein
MLFAGCRWLILETLNGWPFSLSLALLGGSSVTAGVCFAAVWLARITLYDSRQA